MYWTNQVRWIAPNELTVSFWLFYLCDQIIWSCCLNVIISLLDWSVRLSLRWSHESKIKMDEETNELISKVKQWSCCYSHMPQCQMIGTLTFSSYSTHQQNKRRMKWRTRERGKESYTEEGRMIRANTNWSFGDEIIHSHPWQMDECLWRPLHPQRERISENKRNWFSPTGKESMSEGHLSALLLFLVGIWGHCPKCENYFLKIC